MENKDKQPTLETERLILRPFSLADAKDVQRLAGDVEIAATTQNIPHPYLDGMAETWIGSHPEKSAKGESASFAVVEKESGQLVGSVGFHNIRGNQYAEIGYWIGKPFWGRGYATEAARKIIEYGFQALGFSKIVGLFFSENGASGRVMEKIGLVPVRLIKNHTVKWGHPIDAWEYEILKINPR